MLSLTSGNMSPAEVDLLWRTDRPRIGADQHRLARYRSILAPEALVPYRGRCRAVGSPPARRIPWHLAAGFPQSLAAIFLASPC